MHVAKPKMPNSKVCILYDYLFYILEKKNYGDGKQIRICQGLGVIDYKGDSQRLF